MNKGDWLYLTYFCGTCLCGVSALAANTAQAANEIPLHRDSVIRFATRAEGAALLKTRDRFVAAMSPFDRQARLKVSRAVDEQEYLRFASAQAIDWEPQHMEQLTAVIDALRKHLAGLRLPLPKTVMLVRTTGQEEGGAAYCRGNGIILPQGKPGASEEAAQRLLLHELFHILSSHQRELRHRLYALIGFRPCQEIQLPGDLRDRKITNPDGPVIAYYIELREDNQRFLVAPVLFSSVDRFPPGAKNFFGVMQFKLMQVESENDRWRARLVDGQPILLDVDTREKIPASFFAQIGQNTGYVIHPDEILADNFVHLVLGKKKLPSPELIREMRRLLSTDRR